MGCSVHDIWDCTVAVEVSFFSSVYGCSDSVFPGLYGPGKKYTIHYAGADGRPDAITGLLEYADFRGAK